MPATAVNRHIWICPSCRRTCCCAACRRRKDREDDRMVINHYKVYENTTSSVYIDSTVILSNDNGRLLRNHMNETITPIIDTHIDNTNNDALSPTRLRNKKRRGPGRRRRRHHLSGINRNQVRQSIKYDDTNDHDDSGDIDIIVDESPEENTSLLEHK